MHILRFDSEAAWIKAVVAFCRDRLILKPTSRFCLPSGSSPEKIFAALGETCGRKELSFHQAEIFALDEYGGLPPDEPGLCVNCLRRQLVRHIDLPAHHFHWFDMQAPDLDAVCRDYEAALAPGFDITLLGIGLNGHLGLNEPGSLPDSPTRRITMHPQSTQSSAKAVRQAPLPTWGMTVGMKTLLASREVWLLANGRAKAEVVRRTVHGPISPDFPASLMRRHPDCYFFVDPEAAAGLD